MTRTILLSLLILCLAPVAAYSQDAPPADNKSLDATVIVLEGAADYLPAGADENDIDAWKALEKGATLRTGAQVATYDKSLIDLRFADNSVVTISQNSLVTIDQFFYDAEKQAVVTDLRLTTGNVKVEVLESNVQTDMRVSTPNATASVTGTGFTAGTAGGFGSRFTVSHGSVRASNSTGGNRNVGAGQKTDGNLTPNVDLVLVEIIVGDGTSRTDAEDQALLGELGTTTGKLPGEFGGGAPGDVNRFYQGINVGGEDTNFCCPPPELPQQKAK